MAPALAAPLLLVSLAVTLTAARAFARRLDRLGVHFGLPEAVIGLLTAIAADGPEISTALIALIKGAHGVSVGVLVGSNVFNLAAMIGLSALLVGSVALPREVLRLEAAPAVGVFAVVAALLLGWIPALAAAALVLAVLVPYVFVMLRAPDAGLERAAPVPEAGDPARHLAAIVALDVPLIVGGSFGMVQATLALGTHWGISNALLGVLILGPLTSIPNAMTAIRLGRARRGAALVSEAFNSNTLNLAAGVALPALFVTVAAGSALAKADLAWLAGMTATVIALLSRRAGVGRAGAAVLVAGYAGFVVLQLALG
jgi:cation:H+ antiporter